MNNNKSEYEYISQRKLHEETDCLYELINECLLAEGYQVNKKDPISGGFGKNISISIRRLGMGSISIRAGLKSNARKENGND